MTLTESVVDGISDNLRLLVGLGGGYVLGVESGVIEGGYPTLPSVPGYWDLVVLVGLAVVAVSFVVGSKLAALLPDPKGTFLIAQEAHDGTGGEVWELNDEAWNQLEIHYGSLYPWEGTPWDVYECRRYNPDTNAAVANWKGTDPASALSDQLEPEEVMRHIQRLRENHEQQARFGKAIRDGLSALVRELDYRRTRDLNRALEGRVSSPTGEGEKIDDIIRDFYPDEVLPDHILDDGEDDDAIPDDVGGEVDGEIVGFDLLDEGEALDPTADLDGVDADPLRNDGGTER